MSSGASNILEVSGLVTAFDTDAGRLTAVDGVSFEVPRSKTLGIVGESGCGKSVTAFSITRLLPQPHGKILGGSIRFEGTELTTLPLDEMRDLRGNDITHVVCSPLERARQTATPIADAHGVEPQVDDRLIEAANRFEGMRVSVGDGALRDPRNWPKLYDPFTPSWGEPYLKIAHRMLAAVQRARCAAVGHEAVCVSHQLPIWTLRRFCEGKRLWHDPRRRQCALASVTSFVFDDEQLVNIAYQDPAGTANIRATGA